MPARWRTSSTRCSSASSQTTPSAPGSPRARASRRRERRRRGGRARGVVHGVAPVPGGAGGEAAVRPRRRGSPLGRRSASRVPGAPPRLEHAGAAAPPLHRAAGALRAAAELGWREANATTISLSPLSTEEAARLLHVLLDRTLLPAETQAVLLERAGGNPLYAEQFARMLAERGDVEDLAVPETVHALMAARLDTLRPELKALLHDAAVVGRIFWSGSVAAIGERDRAEVRRELNELVHREFVRPVRVSVDRGRGRVRLLARARPRRRLPPDPADAPCRQAHRCGELDRDDRRGSPRGPGRDPRPPLRAGVRAQACGRGRGLRARRQVGRLLVLAGDRASLSTPPQR